MALRGHRADEETLFVFGNSSVAAVEHEGRALSDAGIDVTLHTIPLLTSDHRPHLDTWLQARSDVQPRRLLLQGVDKPVAALTDCHDSRNRHAPLARRTKPRAAGAYAPDLDTIIRLLQ